MSSRDDKTKDLFDQLKGRATAFTESDAWRNFLKMSAKFHRYSANNQWLIFVQYPEASAVNSYNRWRQIGRQVRRGEHGIRILAPVPVQYREVVNGKEEERSFMRFKSVAVFAYEQTDPIEGFSGTPWEPFSFPKLTGETGAEAYQTLKTYLTDIGIPVTEEQISFNAMGYYELDQKRIVVDPRYEGLMLFHVLLHEAAHALHFQKFSKDDDGQPMKSKAYREVVAEAAAYIAAEAIGVDTSAHADVYIGAMMAPEPDVIDVALPAIQKIAHDLIEALTATQEAQVAA